MAIETLSDLQNALQSWLWNRSDVVAQIPTFIQLAEAQMNRRLTSRLKTAVNSSFSVGAEFVNVPADFAGAVSIKLQTDPIHELVNKTPDGIAELWNNTAQAMSTGRPSAYAVVGSQFQFFRVPDQAYTATLVYRQRISPLVNAGDTNWVLTYHPDAYLYGSLLQSASWLKDDARIPTWQAAFAQILADIKSADVVETLAAHMTPKALMVI